MKKIINLKHFGLFFCVLFLLSGCVSMPTVPPTEVDQGIVLKDLCRDQNIRWDWDSVAQVVTLTSGFQTAKVLVGSNIVIVGEDKIELIEPVKVVHSSVIVPSDFQYKVVSRLKNLSPVKNVQDSRMYKVRTIILDAGHGGKDPGALGGSGSREKDIVLDITERVRKILLKNGFKIIMTRNSDKFITLKLRTEIASKSKAELFVSIHANSNPSKNVKGVETYSSKPLNATDRNEDQRKRNEYLMFRDLKMKHTDSTVKSILSDMLYSYKEAESAQLALNVTEEVANISGTRFIGAKDARFFVLRNTLIPAVLVEVGFLTNSKEEKLLKTSSYRQKIAMGVAKSIINYAQN